MTKKLTKIANYIEVKYAGYMTTSEMSKISKIFNYLLSDVMKDLKTGFAENPDRLTVKEFLGRALSYIRNDIKSGNLKFLSINDGDDVTPLHGDSDIDIFSSGDEEVIEGGELNEIFSKIRDNLMDSLIDYALGEGSHNSHDFFEEKENMKSEYEEFKPLNFGDKL